MIKPNFKHSILNLSATLSDFIGYKNELPKLTVVQDALKNEPTNVVFIIFDGLGVYNINKLTKYNHFYKNHIVDTISSTMPATTTNATTTLASAKYPDEHLWLAWSLWLKNQERVVEIYTSKDYYTREDVAPYSQQVENYIDRANTDRKLLTIAPGYVHYSNNVTKLVANNIEQLFDKLSQALKEPSEKFIYCYCDEPDHSMHDFGIDSKQAKAKFEEIQLGLEKLMKENKNVVCITTADHGHINVKKYIKINDDKEILSLLERPISMESRFASFKVKQNKINKFITIFNKKYGKYFDLISQKQFLDNHIFGLGNNKDEMKTFIGDFIAVGNNTYYAFNLNNSANPLKGCHAGGSREEMEVPVCIFES